MKRIFLILFALSLFAMDVNAQTSQKDEKIVVNSSDLTADQLAAIKARKQSEALINQVETYGKFAGIGKEVGVAIKEGLTAVKDVAVEFSDTNVGMFTMVLIAWKVAGDDIMSFVVGVPLYLLCLFMLAWAYKRMCMRQTVLVSKEEGVFGKKTYRTEDPVLQYTHAASAFFGLVFVIINIIFGVTILA